MYSHYMLIITIDDLLMIFVVLMFIWRVDRIRRIIRFHFVIVIVIAIKVIVRVMFMVIG